MNHAKNQLRLVLVCTTLAAALSACLDEPTHVDAGSLPDARTPDAQALDAAEADAGQ